jgi:hypothetical protein
VEQRRRQGLLCLREKHAAQDGEKKDEGVCQAKPRGRAEFDSGFRGKD